MGSETGMGDVEVLLRVAGDSSGAQKSFSDMAQKAREATRTVAQQLREQGSSAAQAAEAYKSLGFTGEESARQISAAFGSIPGAIAPAKASVNSFGQAVRSNLGDLLVLRRAMYASFGLISFGYLVTEWQSVAKAIKNAAQALGGYDAFLQQVQQDSVAFSTAAFQSGGGDLQQKLLEAAKNAKTLVGFEKERVQLEMQYAQAAKQRTTQELNVELPAYYERQKQIEELQAKLTAQVQKQGFGSGLVASGAEGVTALQNQIAALQKMQDATTFAGQSYKQLAQAEKELSKTQTEAQKKVLALEIQIQTQRLSGDQKALTSSKHTAAELARDQAAAARSAAALYQDITDFTIRLENQSTAAFKRQIEAAREVARENQSINDEIQQRGSEANFGTGLKNDKALAAYSEARQEQRIKAILDQAKTYYRALAQIQKGFGDLGPQGDKDAAAHNAILKNMTASKKAVLELNDALLGTHASMQKFSGEQAIMSNMAMNFSSAMGQNIAQAIVYGQSVGKAMETAAKATIASLASRAIVYALYETAVGAADMFFDPPAAAAFESAALFGAVGAAAAGAAAAIPGGGGGGRGGRGISGPSRNNGGGSRSDRSSSGSGDSGQQVVPSGNFATPPKNGNLTIAIMGDAEAGAWMAGAINKVVQQGGAELTATHTTAIPQPMA